MSCSVTLAMCADAGREVVDALTVRMPAAPVVGDEVRAFGLVWRVTGRSFRAELGKEASLVVYLAPVGS